MDEPLIWRGQKIIVDNPFPPIPVRKFDWSAVTEDYDAELVDGEWRSSCPVGYGATRDEAVYDLIAQLEDTVT